MGAGQLSCHRLLQERQPLNWHLSQDPRHDAHALQRHYSHADLAASACQLRQLLQQASLQCVRPALDEGT